MLQRIESYIAVTRPITLLAPAFGVLCGAVVAREATSTNQMDLTRVLVAALALAVLNAASNTINQVCDLRADRVNKPDRPLPCGRLSLREAIALSVLLYLLALALACLSSRQGFCMTLAIAAASVVYSVPPVRLKRFWWTAQPTIALARGLLVFLCGWACVVNVWNTLEPWYLGSTFALFLLGASATKDFSDMPGDQADGCRTLPLQFGPLLAWRLIAPCFILPWWLLPLGTFLPNGKGSIIGGDLTILTLLALALSLYGMWVIWACPPNIRSSARKENHSSWRHMYCLLLLAQIGLPLAYLIH